MNTITINPILGVVAVYLAAVLLFKTIYEMLHIKKATKLAYIWPLSAPFIIIAYCIGLLIGLVVGIKKRTRSSNSNQEDKDILIDRLKCCGNCRNMEWEDWEVFDCAHRHQCRRADEDGQGDYWEEARRLDETSM